MGVRNLSSRITLLYITFLLSVFTTTAQELESNKIFKEVYSCHFKITGDILLFRKDEIVSVQFIPSRDSMFGRKILVAGTVFDSQEGVYKETFSRSIADSSLYSHILDSLKSAGFTEPTMEAGMETNKEGVTTYTLKSGTRILVNREKPIDGRYFLMLKRKKQKEIIAFKVETPCYYFAEFYQYKPNEVIMVLSASYCEDNIFKICYLFRD